MPRRPKCGHPVTAARSCSSATSMRTAALILRLWTRLMNMEYWWNVKDDGWENSLPSPLHPLHWNTLRLAPGLCVGQPVANRLVTTAGARNAHCTPISSQLTVAEKPPFLILQNTFLRNKLHLFSLTQHRFDSNCAFTCALHFSACQYKNLTKEDIILI